MFLWSAGVLFPSEFHGINLDSGIYAPPSSSWVLCPFPSPPPLQLVLVSSDSASLVEKKQEPVVMNIKKQSYFKETTEDRQNPWFSWACLPCTTEPVCTQNSGIFMPQHSHRRTNHLFNDCQTQLSVLKVSIFGHANVRHLTFSVSFE